MDEGWWLVTRRIYILPRRQELRTLPIRAHPRLLSAPRSVSPGEEHDVQFLHDVGVGDVEVVFEGGDVDVFVDLFAFSISLVLTNSDPGLYGRRDQDAHSAPHTPARPWPYSCRPGSPSARWGRS